VALPELNSYKELLYIAGDVDEFVEKLGEAVLEVNVTMRQRRVDFARQNSWHSRYQAIRSAILRMPLQEDVMRQFGISKNFILSYQNKWPELQWTKPNWQEFFNTLSPLHQMTVPFALSTVLRGRNVFKLLESNSYIGKKQRYLDIGTGYGGFLRAFKEQGFDEVVGIELQQQLAEFAKANTVGVDNAQVVVGNFVQDDFSYLGTFDVVTCNDVIEHVDDAGVAIRKMSELLCDGGCLCLEIPNKDFIDFVKSDGDFQIFGITQLDRGSAAAYYSEVLALDINKYFFEMGEMYELDWYVEHLADSGLSASMIDTHKVCEAGDALGLIDDFERAYKAWHIVIKPQIGSAIAEKLMMAVDSYIRQLKLDYSKINDETSKRYFENKYLRSFWTIAAVKHKKR
jgi:2-polyprenyl-3-methyl-5-hydroxy-6-metoxy-1,4-benzoquinol methylase